MGEGARGAGDGGALRGESRQLRVDGRRASLRDVGRGGDGEGYVGVSVVP